MLVASHLYLLVGPQHGDRFEVGLQDGVNFSRPVKQISNVNDRFGWVDTCVREATSLLSVASNVYLLELLYHPVCLFQELP